MARYFVHLPPDGSPAIYWRPPGVFAGIPFHYNLNLLARALGDEPAARLPAWADLVKPQMYDYGGGDIQLQPFAFSPQGGNANRPEGLPIGTNLNRFLNDPLLGERLELSLPFYDEQIKLGPAGGGFYRKENDATAFHGGTDFNKRPRGIFDVCASAPGKVLARDSGNGSHGGCLVLSHFTASSREYRTLYMHLDMNSIPSELAVGTQIRRGQFIGRVVDVSIIHLHFGVAVQAPSVRISGVNVPALWYFIDPWGVYDYYEHDSRTHSTYLPPENQADIYRARISGNSHTIHWQTQPLALTIPVARFTEGYQIIASIHSRAYTTDNFLGTTPVDHDQLMVWLRDDPEPFLFHTARKGELPNETGLMALLRDAFVHQLPVRLEYRHNGDSRYIMAVWVQAQT